MSKKNKKADKKGTAIESPEALQEEFTRIEHYLENHRTAVITVASIVLVAIISVFGYRYYISQQNQQAQTEMFQAVYYFEADSLDLALNGDGNNLGFLDIVDEYSGTDAANLADFYIGTIYLQKGNYNSAIEYLEEFSSGDILLQARAMALTGDAYMEIGNFERAAEYYNSAADYKPNQYFTPTYLMKAALAYEKLNDFESAKEMYDRIVKDFFNSSEFQDAKKQSARMQALLSS